MRSLIICFRSIWRWHQVQDMTKRLLRLNAMPKPDDAADAIAIALCHARSSTSLLAQIQAKQ